MLLPSGPGYRLRRDAGTAGRGRSSSTRWRRDHADRLCSWAMVRGVALGFLGGACCALGDSCGRPELPRRDADEALEVVGEVALVREAHVRGDLRQGEGRPCLKEFLGALDAARDDVQVRRPPGGPLELP